MRLPQDKILHIDTKIENGKVNIVAEWQGELVRCKDCKHFRIEGNTTKYRWCKGLNVAINGNDYCSHAERREP